MLDTVANVGPVAVTFNVAADFLTYKSGIYQSTECDSGTPHSLLVVGYGSENNVPYWIVKNSRGT